ncbi:MAG: endonuclease III [Dehalococcoidia bacterium]|nr:endonuclease III [Dehalococcoidia bacterium]
MTGAEIVRRLRKEYGPRRWRSGQDPVSSLIATVLSQNTSDVNSHRAFAALMERFGSWKSMAAADTAELAETIRAGGLAEIKARRIKQILHEIRAARGSFDLGFLSELSLAEAKSWLRGLPGVGPKTAGCVLLFSLGRPAMPVDTHVYRVARRLGLLDRRVSVEKAHDILERMVPAKDVYEFHILMVEHGRRTCKAQRPRCAVCVLREACPSASSFAP